MKAKAKAKAKDDPAAEPLIPGLPDDVAEQCLLHLPFPYQNLARSVSSSWNRALSSPSFLRSKSALLSLPYLFVFAFHRPSLHIQWQALDPQSRRWFPLPPMPLPSDGPICPPAFACAALASRAEIYVLGGMRSDTQTPLDAFISYRAATNTWSAAPGPPMPTPRSFFAAAGINGRIFAAGGEDPTVESYDPEAGRWAPGAGMRGGIARYDAAVVEGKILVTEGWTWPFNASPRGAVYDAEGDTWEEMRAGMKEGWTGVSAVVDGRLFVVSEYGEGKVKVYDQDEDTWRKVEGGGVPAGVKRPFAVSGGKGRIYVVGSGLDVGVGTVGMKEGKRWTVDWEMVTGPKAFGEFTPCNSVVLYL